jgi:hypothetical protein
MELNMGTKLGMREFRVFYTADRANGSRLEGQLIVVADCILDAKQRAWWILRMDNVINPRNLQAIDNS